VQGPPGTGKTSTICGMLAMILQRDSEKKIHLCAPSNSAVDEILMRILSQGLCGYSPDELKKIILRVGATMYKAPEALQCIDVGFIL